MGTNLMQLLMLRTLWDKAIQTMALLCVILLTLAGCGQQTDSVPTVSAYDLQKIMLAADDSLPEMLTVNSNASNAEENFAYLSTLDYAKVSDYFLAYSATGMADEIAVIILKNAEDTGEAVKTLEKHVQDRVNMYSFYEPEQKQRAENALVFSQGSYAVLIISDNARTVRTAFTDAVANVN